ncbi:hypothetical protein AVP43_02975 [Geobacillus stearothermophilus]|nr:hypothetical protein AVP43_02975 [Geobacillus stearothermophilus]
MALMAESVSRLGETRYDSTIFLTASNIKNR